MNEKIKENYEEILHVSNDNNIYYERYTDTVYKINSTLYFYNNKFKYNRIFEEYNYIDIISDENCKFKFEKFAYLYDPEKSDFIIFRDPNIRIKPSVNNKVLFSELYLSHINSSIINVYLDKTKIGHLYIDYTNKNITMFDYIEKKVYRYTKNTSFESSFVKINDPCVHNNIIENRFKINEYNIIKGNIQYEHIQRHYNTIESIYDYNIPANIYENMYENMRCKVLVDIDNITNKISFISKTIYTKKE